MVNTKRLDYAVLAADAILDLLGREHAAAWLEVEAKLAERPHPQLPHGINPHHLTNARRRLVAAGLVDEITEPTRGGSRLTVLALAERRRRKTAFERAAARKRLLLARYRGWATGSATSPNMIGAAGERVAHTSLRVAAEAGAGYLLARPEGGHVAALFDAPVPGGPLDDAAYLTVLDPARRPVPLTILVEVKNIRDWIYPSAAELFQLLDKAARLQQAQPDQRFVPVLACRRAHYNTFRMARDLGFFVFEAKAQPILPHAVVTVHAVEEVRDELGFDLVRTEEANDLLVHGFRVTLPREGLRAAEHWRRVAVAFAQLLDVLRQLRDPSFPPAARAMAMESYVSR